MIKDVAISEITTLVQQGRRMEAIQLYMKTHGKGLKESKDFIDTINTTPKHTSTLSSAEEQLIASQTQEFQKILKQHNIHIWNGETVKITTQGDKQIITVINRNGTTKLTKTIGENSQTKTFSAFESWNIESRPHHTIPAFISLFCLWLAIYLFSNSYPLKPIIISTLCAIIFAIAFFEVAKNRREEEIGIIPQIDIGWPKTKKRSPLKMIGGFLILILFLYICLW